MQLARAMWPLLADGATAATANARAAAAASDNHVQASSGERKSGLLFVSSGSSLIPAPFVSTVSAYRRFNVASGMPV